MVLYAVGPEITAECLAVAKGAGIALIEVKHLQAACAALKAGPAAMLVASSTVKWWDRAVIEEHAARAAGPTRWVSEADIAVIGREILSWAVETSRPRRPVSVQPTTRTTYPGSPRTRR